MLLLFDHNSLIVLSFKRPELIDDEDGDVERKPREPTGKKSLTATGRKPKLTATDTLFEQIWKSANKELKRFIYFVNPFPNSEDYDLLPRRAYIRATNLVRQSSHRYIGNIDSRAREAYSPEWSSSVSHQPAPHLDRNSHPYSYPIKSAYCAPR